MRNGGSILGFVSVAVVRLCVAAAQDPVPLPGTEPLAPSTDRSAEMVAGIGKWLEAETARVAAVRADEWRTAASHPGDWKTFLDKKRALHGRRLGITVDPRIASRFIEERSLSPDPQATATTTPGAANSNPRVAHVRWPVFDRVQGEGILYAPASPRAFAVVIPDAGELPEENELARELALRGCVVVVPVIIDRRDTWSGNEALQRFTNQPHREWIYRQAFEMGRTLIGLEVQKMRAAIDAGSAEPAWSGATAHILIAGTGEGALIALHAAAADERITATMVRGYFGPRENLFAEPIDRNVFALLRDFGDAELATLIAPRALTVDAAPAKSVDGPPASRAGRSGAAPGAWRSPEDAAIRSEVARANDLRAHLNAPPIATVDSAKEREKPDGFSAGSLLRVACVDQKKTTDPIPVVAKSTSEIADARQRRAIRELETFIQKTMPAAERRRHAALEAKLSKKEEWTSAQKTVREQLANEVIGTIRAEPLPLHPRSRVVREAAKWTAHEIVLDVFPEVFAWGWLLIPRDLQPGERRPVVICQHGLEGVPEDVVTDDAKSRAFATYKAFAAKLAERGFVVYAPHNPYRGRDGFRILQRRANPIGLSLFSFIIAQHDATTRWLATLPFVDSSRIAFYGLSYGGKTAMRVPVFVDRYCLSICSGDFNEWIFKNVTVDAPFSYMFTGEYEMPEWNLGEVANYAEMAMLIAPRPFMVERGHDDAVAVDEWVAYEYAKVRRAYTKLGIPERTRIEWFDGPHTIHGIGTFDFLHEQLRWPKPQ
jgi:dienelactone hydrolase